MPRAPTDWLPVIQAEHRTELLSSQPGLVSLIIFLMMDFPQKIFLMNFVTIVLSHPWQTWQAAFNQYFKKFAWAPAGWRLPAPSSVTAAWCFLPSPTITQHWHINQNINNGITPRPPLPSQQQPQYIIVVPLSAGTKVIRILLMSVPSLCWVFVVQGPVSCPSPVTACPSHDGVWPTGPAADKWSSKVSSPPSPFNGVQTIEKLNQLSPVQIHPVSLHSPDLSPYFL